MVCQISKSSSASRGVILRYQLFLYPGTKDEILSTCEAAKLGLWPGLKVAEGDFPLGPVPGSKSLASLLAKWERIKRSLLEAASKLPQASWPKPTEQQPDKGN